MFKITVETKQHPTEDREKVMTALNNILLGEVQVKEFGDTHYLVVESTDHHSLQKLYEMVRQQRILDVARKRLRGGMVNNGTIFYLNKQVAFVNKLNFCDEEGESPLDPIRVEIEYENISNLIDWLTPYTKNGEEVKLVKSFP